MKISPPYWFTEMRDPTLQLMIEHQGTHTFLDVNLRGCKAGTIILTADINGSRISFPYELRERAPESSERRGFSQSDTVYLLMPDRFGGKLKKITQHLDYLADLGVTALWMTPITESTSYHGYDTTNYFAVNPRFGTFDDYKTLVEEAHDRGMKVIMDFVFNHCGSKHPWICNPPESDWINHPSGDLLTNYRLTPTIDPYAADVDVQQTVEGWFVKTMPDLNLRNSHLLRYLTQCTIWWIESTAIDGIRMDTFPYAVRDAMEQWLKTLHTEYPHFHVVGETWVCNSAFTARLQEGELDSTMDFALFEAFNYAKHEDSKEWWSGLNRIYNTLCYDYLYREPSMTMAFLDNHDTNRFLENDITPKRIQRMKVALAILLTIPRIPQIYYGTEILMGGTTENSDENVRKHFPGSNDRDSHNAFTADGRTAEQNDMHAFLRKLLHWRKGNDVITHGTTKQFMPHNGVYVLVRQHEGRTVMLIANGNDSPTILHTSHYAEVLSGKSKAKDVINHRTVKLGKTLRLTSNKLLLLEF